MNAAATRLPLLPACASALRNQSTRQRGPWCSCEAVEIATLQWVDWFNHRRLLEPIGNIPPAEAEACY